MKKWKKGTQTAVFLLTAAMMMAGLKVTDVSAETPAADESGTNSLTIALNVYYNDAETGYYSNESGVPIVITGDGQYTLTFNCEEDLSEKAVEAGVTSLHNLTAVYIKDHDVTTGKEITSPLSSCDIQFDEVVVDGVPMTITQTEPKSALKPSGVLDTNDPLNSWDGSQVEEVIAEDHVLNITSVENPTKIEVVFTLSNMVFTETAADTEEPESSDTPESPDTPELSDSPAASDTPADADTPASSDSSESSEATAAQSQYIVFCIIGFVIVGGIAIWMVLSNKKKKKNNGK